MRSKTLPADPRSSPPGASLDTACRARLSAFDSCSLGVPAVPTPQAFFQEWAASLPPPTPLVSFTSCADLFLCVCFSAVLGLVGSDPTGPCHHCSKKLRTEVYLGQVNAS